MAINKIIIVALAPTGTGISGSDRIFIELARNWSKNIEVDIITTIEGIEMCKKQDLSGRNLRITSISDNLPSNFLFKYFYKIFLGIKYGLSFKTNDSVVIYSSSDFWMDVFPALLIKIRNTKKVFWTATWFQTAPNPFTGFGEIERKNKYFISAAFYWISQLPVKPLFKLFSNLVVVNNEAERKQFKKANAKGEIFVMIGAVRLDEIEKYKRKYTSSKKIYHSVFQGRFHPQKGVVELVEIWKYVTEKIPKAKLAMIGDGPLMEEVKRKVKEFNLNENIELFGYLFDGDKKYKIFAESEIVLHPAFYDSGGMASAEAMSFGLPAIGFDLKAYESYYPKGMIKVKNGNLKKFSEEIVMLLKNKNARQGLGKEALEMIKENWSWEKRSDQLLSKINTYEM